MITTDLIPILEQLDRIEKKLEGQFVDKYLDINQVSKLTSVSVSTIRRRVALGELKCNKRLGKLLFKQSSIDNWLKS